MGNYNLEEFNNMITMKNTIIGAHKRKTTSYIVSLFDSVHILALLFKHTS